MTVPSSDVALLSGSVLPVDLPSSDLAELVSDLEAALPSLGFVVSVLLSVVSERAVVSLVASFDEVELDWEVLLRELVALEEEVVLLERGPGLCALDGGGAGLGSADAAASTSAEKLSVYCEGSGRVAFGAVPWKAVLAVMSDVTLTTLEPLAMGGLNRRGSARSGPSSWIR
jgi:hypothetical protein